MSKPVTCTACNNDIKRGEKYTSLLRQTEKIGRFGRIRVLDADWAPFHTTCTPRPPTSSKTELTRKDR